MSFDKQKSLVEDGDTVVLYLGRQQMLAFQIDGKKTHQTKYGAFPHKEFIGKRYGTKVYSPSGKGFVYLLHPSPELWTVTLPHRTQILYSTDISQITMELELKPGSVVVESGTGSGSLSHAIVRTIKPTGHLYTFDFHKERTEKAREEFVQHGIGDFVTSKCADVCKDGFGLENVADSVFLDLPGPWDAIPHAKKALKKCGGRLCSFSPCIEQVQRSCFVLRKLGFCEIKTVECLVRSYNVWTVPFMEANIGQNNVRMKRETSPDEKEPITKILKLETKTLEIQKENNIFQTTEQQNLEAKSVSGVLPNGMVAKLTAQTRPGNVNVLTAKPNKDMPGHTGYLTFASLYSYHINIDVN